MSFRVRILCCSVLVTAIRPIVSAQEQDHAPWTVMVNAGLQTVRLNDPLGVDNGSKTGRTVHGTGYFLGAGLERAVRRNAWIRLEFHGSERNTSIRVDDTQRPYGEIGMEEVLDVGTKSYRLRSVTIPMLVTWERWSGFRFVGGFTLSKLLSARERFTGQRFTASGEQWEGTETVDRTDALAPLEWSAVLGMEVHSEHRFGLGVRYVVGLTDLDRSLGASPTWADQFQVVAVIPLFRFPSPPEPMDS